MKYFKFSIITPSIEILLKRTKKFRISNLYLIFFSYSYLKSKLEKLRCHKVIWVMSRTFYLCFMSSLQWFIHNLFSALVYNRVSSEKGKSFRENFAFFTFRSLKICAKNFHFFAEILVNLFREILFLPVSRKDAKFFAIKEKRKFRGGKMRKYYKKIRNRNFYFMI